MWVLGREGAGAGVQPHWAQPVSSQPMGRCVKKGGFPGPTWEAQSCTGTPGEAPQWPRRPGMSGKLGIRLHITCLLNMHFCTTFHPGHQSTWHTMSPERFKWKMSDHRFLSHLITGRDVPVTWPASTQAAPLAPAPEGIRPGAACGQIQRQARIAAKC